MAQFGWDKSDALSQFTEAEILDQLVSSSTVKAECAGDQNIIFYGLDTGSSAEFNSLARLMQNSLQPVRVEFRSLTIFRACACECG